MTERVRDEPILPGRTQAPRLVWTGALSCVWSASLQTRSRQSGATGSAGAKAQFLARLKCTCLAHPPGGAPPARDRAAAGKAGALAAPSVSHNVFAGPAHPRPHVRPLYLHACKADACRSQARAARYRRAKRKANEGAKRPCLLTLAGAAQMPTSLDASPNCRYAFRRCTLSVQSYEARKPVHL